MTDATSQEQPRNSAESPESLRRRVLRSTASNYAGQITTLLTWFLLTPFLVAQLGAETYGLFVLVIALMGYASLLDLGVTSSVTRYVAALRAEDDLEELRRLVATAFVLSLALCAVTIAVGASLAPFVPDLFGVAAEQRDTARWLVVLAAVSAGLVFPTGTLFAVLRGLQRYDLTNLLGILATLMVAAATVTAVLLGGGVLWVVGVSIPVALVVQVPALWAVRRADPELRLGAGRPRRRFIRTIASFSWAVVIVQGAGQIKTKTDEIVIAALLPVARVTPYALARRVSEAPQLLAYQFIRVLMPLSAQLAARGEQDRLRGVLLTGSRLALAAYLLLGSAIMVLAGPFMGAWVGSEYRSAGTILVVLAVAGAIDTAMWPLASVFQGILRHRPLAVFALLGAAVNLGASIALVLAVGPIGAALGTLIATSVECVLFTVPYALRVTGVGIAEVWRVVLLPAVVPAFPSAAVALVLREVFDPQSLVAVMAIGALAVVTYAAVYFAFGTCSAEWSLFSRTVARVARVIRRRIPRIGSAT